MPVLTPQQIEDAARAMPDPTLATSFLEPDTRARVIALILFAHEIARARSVVSEAGLAAIRLQWWRQTVDQIYSGQVVRAQPTAIALAGAVSEASLPRALLDAMIDGHERELEAVPFQTWAELDDYLDATTGNLTRLCLLATGLPAITSKIENGVRQLAVAWGLAQLLRVTPTWLERRSLWLPHVACTGLDLESVFGGTVSGDLLTVFKTVLGRIKSAQGAANRGLGEAKLGQAFPVIAHACLSTRYAKCAIPAIGEVWAINRDVSLFERQVRITTSVARSRI